MKQHELDAPRAQSKNCKACDLWHNATQTVFGEGNPGAKMVLVGEQPGDVEDLKGHPFAGPAGTMLDRALAEAGLDRRKLYITNAVKHFRWELHGQRRLHKTPAQQEIEACRRWLEGELATINPALVVCLGGTAARALTGRTIKLGGMRGQIYERDTGHALLFTVHPSYILRLHADSRTEAYDALVADLKIAAGYLNKPRK
jgi:uracil-DNA glycosylase family protein